jgi:hypothetical protein
MKTIKIKRSKWLRGNRISMLRNHTGEMCCLGFAIKQISKVSNSKITLKYGPSGVFTKKSFLTCTTHGDVSNNNLASKAIKINDNPVITDSEREEKLKDLFQENGYNIVFED